MLLHYCLKFCKIALIHINTMNPSNVSYINLKAIHLKCNTNTNQLT